jgi:hypothetical protein
MPRGYGSIKYTDGDLDLQTNRTKIDIENHTYDWQEPNNEQQYGRGIFLVFLCVLAVLGVASYSHVDMMMVKKVQSFIMTPPAPPALLPNVPAHTVDPDAVTIVAKNEYGTYSAPYSWLDDGALVEPYKQTTLSISGNSFVPCDAYKWTISSSNSDDQVFTTTEPSLELNLLSTGTYSLTIESIDPTTKQSLSTILTKKLFCKYVKRELRSLTDEDREKFLEAASIMWKVNTEEGKKLYGESYTGADTFVEQHSLASNDIRCDAYHEGSGFMTHHFALSNSFEASLRAINPEVTLHYWDFTIEGQIINDAGAVPSHLLQISDIFTDKWFGSVDENDHIQDSRWAHAQMTKVKANSKVNGNSYSYIRSYWNNNNDNEVVRHLFDVCGFEPTNKAIPTCKSHYDVLNTATLAKFQLLSPSDGHGPLHVQIGGIGGECTEKIASFVDRWSDILNADMSDDDIARAGLDPSQWKWGNTAPRMAMFKQEIMGEYFHIYRSLWRSHMCSRDNTPQLLRCPESCDESATTSSCKCQVESLVNGDTDYENVYYCIASDHVRSGFAHVFPKEFIEDLVTTISTTSLYEGEMLEAASPADITFWVIHPTIERLLTAKRLPNLTKMGALPFSKWQSIDGSGEEWLSYSYYTQEAGQNKAYPEAYTCAGHAKDDAALPKDLPLISGFLDKADSNQDGSISNWEYFLATNPNDADGVDYVYDNYDWSHCQSTLGAGPSLPERDVSTADVQAQR